MAVIAEVTYALTDELSLTGGVNYDEIDTEIGAKAVYETDVLNVEGLFTYNFDLEEINDYNVYAEFNVTEKTSIYGEYDDDEGFLAGAAYEFGTDTSLSAEYGFDAEALTVTLFLAM